MSEVQRVNRPAPPAPHPRSLTLGASPQSPMVGSTLTVVATFWAAHEPHDQRRVDARYRPPGEDHWFNLVVRRLEEGIYTAALMTKDYGEYVVEFQGESDTKILERISVIVRPG